jgi:hypothetical protein
MASQSDEAGSMPLSSRAAIFNPSQNNADNAGSDDETLATASNAEKRDSLGKSPSLLDRLWSAPRVARRRMRLRDAKFAGPSPHLNPTNAKLTIQRGSECQPGNSSTKLDQVPTGHPRRDMEIMWRSRDNRKGSVAVPVSPRGGSITMRLVFSSKDVVNGLWRMFSTFPYWDMSFWSGWSYSIGSALFVIDGFWAWLPLVAPGSEFSGQSKYGVPLAFFFGALFYQLGAVMAYLEAINDGSFAGSAMKRLLLGHDKEAQEMLDAKLADFFGHLKPGHGRKGDSAREKNDQIVDPESGWRNMQRHERAGSTASRRKALPRRGGLDLGEPEEGEVEYMTWRWWPTWHRFRTHHIYEVGYLSCAVQLFGVTLYGITSIVILPGILDSLNHWQTNAAYWIPQIVASSCFLIASFGFTWETQSKWYRPEFGVLGWWIGVWSIIGSVGFVLCATFGIASWSSTGNEYQSSLSTTWGSFAYLIGSMLQWYEAANKHSVQDLLENELNPSRLQPIESQRSGHTEAQMEDSDPSPSQQTMMPTSATEERIESSQHVRDPHEVEQQLEASD